MPWFQFTRCSNRKWQFTEFPSAKMHLSELTFRFTVWSILESVGFAGKVACGKVPIPVLYPGLLYHDWVKPRPHGSVSEWEPSYAGVYLGRDQRRRTSERKSSSWWQWSCCAHNESFSTLFRPSDAVCLVSIVQTLHSVDLCFLSVWRPGQKVSVGRAQIGWERKRRGECSSRNRSWESVAGVWTEGCTGHGRWWVLQGYLACRCKHFQPKLCTARLKDSRLWMVARFRFLCFQNPLCKCLVSEISTGPNWYLIWQTEWHHYMTNHYIWLPLCLKGK